MNEGRNPTRAGRILIATMGSLGDLHPCLALARELKRRGHAIRFATTEFYRARVQAEGFEFHALRPDMDPTSAEMIATCADLKTGVEVLLRQIVLPHLTETYEDLLNAAAGADLMLAGEMNFAAPLVAEKIGLRWVSVILSPASFLSAHDPSYTVNVPWLLKVRKLGWPVYRAAMNLGRLTIRHCWEPVRQLRRREGLNPDCDPLFRDKFSPDLVLTLFSPLMGRKQPDWPRQAVQPGFVFLDTPGTDASPDPALERFLAAGDPPLVFTQGSTAVHNPGRFFSVSAEAALGLGRRAVLAGAKQAEVPASGDLFVTPYARYADLFPRAAAIVHQGGSGTTGEALRAGRPMLIVPYGWDQPDNAMRAERLGVGIHLPRTEYTAASAAAALKRLLGEDTFRARAKQAAAAMRTEPGLPGACDEIERVFERVTSH